MALIKCPECGKEVSDTANTCVNCGFNLNNKITKKKKGKGCLITLLSLISILIFPIVFFQMSNSTIQKNASGVSNKSEYITLEEFYKIKDGMTYEEVKSIVGSSGEKTAESGDKKFKIVMVTWYGNGIAGSNANVTFTNGKVSGMAQVGLE